MTSLLDAPLYSNNKKMSKKKSISEECDYCHHKNKNSTLQASIYNGSIRKYDYSKFDPTQENGILHFCDYICARLYDVNIHRICINEKQYRKDYLKNLLTNSAKMIYERKGIRLFTELAYMKVEPIQLTDRHLIKKECEKQKKIFFGTLSDL